MQRRDWLVLASVLVLAAALRVWGLDYGLPQPYARPDEDKLVEPAIEILRTGDLHPRIFNYPSFLIYLDTLLIWARVKSGALFGAVTRFDDYLAALRVSRWVAAAAGVATVAATHALSWTGYRRRAGALLAALFAAVAPLHVRDSHFATVDPVMTLFVTLSLVFAVRIASRGHRLHDYVWAGALAGLAASTKYNGGLVILATAVAALQAPAARVTVTLQVRLRRLLVASGSALVAFAATSPYCLWYWRAMLDGLGMTARIVYAGHGERAFWLHLQRTLPDGLGWPVFLAAVCGGLLALRRRSSTDIVLLAFALPMFVSVATVRMVFPRYSLPLVAPIAVLAAELLAVAIPRRLLALAGVAAALPALWHSVAFDRLASREDTRVLATRWIEANIPPRAPLLVCKGYGAPVLERPGVTEGFCGPRRMTEGLSDFRFLVTQEHPAFTLTGLRPDALRMLQRRGRVVAEFSPFQVGATEQPYFFTADAFFIPYAGFAAVARGGPIVKVWDLRSPAAE